MIEYILKKSIDYSKAVVFFVILIASYGIYSLFQLPIDAVPDITNNQIQINTLVPGLSPVQVEKQVSYVIENSLLGIPGLESTRSLSRSAFSQVTAIFEDQVDIYFARQQVNERLNEIKELLPQGSEVKMGPISTGLGEVYMWSVHYKKQNKSKNSSIGLQANGDYITSEKEVLKTPLEKQAYLRTIQDWIIKPQLKNLYGIAGIDVIGGYVKQYHVEPDIEKMRSFNVSFDELIATLKNNDLSTGSTFLENKGEALLIKADAKLTSVKQIEGLVVLEKEGAFVKVKDLAKVGIGKEVRTGSASENGEEAVIGTALMLIQENSRKVAKGVDLKIQEIALNLPIDIHLEPILNRTKLVDATIKTVTINLSEGALLVIAILFLFLRHFQASLITALIIPLSMLFTVIGMTYFKISGNLMSLGALDFGLIVDGAVIIMENSLRKLSHKQYELKRILNREEKKKELLIATKEMIQPTLFGQAIIIVVYIPILALAGIEGKMFHPMALTVILALISALILSLTFVPAMTNLFVTPSLKEKQETFLEFLKRHYTPLLNYSLKFPSFTLLLSVLAVLLSFLLFLNLGQEFIPKLDEKDIAMHAMRIPSISLAQSTTMQLSLEKTLKKIPEVDYVFSKTGTAEVGSDPMPPNVSDTFIMLKDESKWPDKTLSKDALIAKIEKELKAELGNNYEFTQPIEMRFNELISGIRSDLAVKVYGEDFNQLQKLAESIAEQLKKIPGASDLKINQTKGLPVLDIKINQDAISRFGLNAKEALEVLTLATEGVKIGSLFEGDKKFDIFVKLKEEDRLDVASLKSLPILLKHSPKKDALAFSSIPLSQVASFQIKDELNEIRRENGKRFIVVQANIRGLDLGTFVNEAKNLIKHEVTIPEGYWIDFGGQFQNLMSAKERLFIVVPLAMLMILILLYTAFNSIKLALIIFTGVPLALTGGILSLWLNQMPFSISAAIGFIALSGIAVLNGIVLITYLVQLLNQQIPLDEAIKESALTRLRPAIMTALVASFGFIPMALATGTGAEVQKPLALVVIGGLISSSLLTLVVLPALCKRFKVEAFSKIQ